MDVIFNKVIKSKIIKIMKIYTENVNELIVDLPLSIGNYHTIEYDKVNSDLTLHMFEMDFDYAFNFDDLSADDKLRVYQILKGIQHLN